MKILMVDNCVDERRTRWHIIDGIYKFWIPIFSKIFLHILVDARIFLSNTIYLKHTQIELKILKLHNT